MMQSMALRQFAIDESFLPKRGSAHAIGEGREPVNRQQTAFTRMRGLIGAPPWQAPAAPSNREDDGSAAYGTRTLEEIMADGVPEGTERPVRLPHILHSLDLRGKSWHKFTALA